MRHIKKWLKKQHFHPDSLGWLVNPFFLARQALDKNIADLSNRLSGELLDIGCGSQPYKQYFSITKYVGLEFDTPLNREKKHADYYYDGTKFPIENESFDCALCSQVFEHVFKPDIFLFEINRVLRKNGLLLLTVPFIWDEHEQPFDFARYSSFGITSLLNSADFEVIEHRKTLSDFNVIVQLTCAYLYKAARTRYRLINVLLQLIAIAPLMFIGSLLAKLLPANNDLFLDSIVLARKL